MSLFLNFGFAWISVFLAVMLSIIFVLRKINAKSSKRNSTIATINTKLRKHHKLIGLLLAFTGLIHGLFSSQSVFSLNLGTVAWIISILLGVNWMLRKYFSKYRGWMFYHRFLTVIFILVIGLHVVDVGGVQAPGLLKSLINTSTTETAYKYNSGNLPSDNSTSYSVSSENNSSAPSSPSTATTIQEGATLKDGTYIGESTGYRPGLKVQVEVQDNSIKSVKVIEENEVNRNIFQRAIDTIPQSIVEEQTSNVDSVSGATFTSIGIMNAVNNALSQALVSGTLPSTLELPANRGHGKGTH